MYLDELEELTVGPITRLTAISLLAVITLCRLGFQLYKRRSNQRMVKQCIEILPGWKHLSATDLSRFRFTQLAGLSNAVVKVEALAKRPSEKPPTPAGVVVKRFAASHFYLRKTERQVVQALSDLGLGPRLLHEEADFRVEELLPGTPINRAQLAQPSFACAAARLLGQFHRTQVDLGAQDEPILYRNLRDWFSLAIKLQSRKRVKFSNSLSALSQKTSRSPRRKALRIGCFDMDKLQTLEPELDWLRGVLSPLRSPIVLGHNDSQALNLLAKGGRPETLRLIDFEYANYNFRAFDLANTMCEMYIDNDAPEWPFYSLRLELLPDAELRRAFLRSYLAAHHQSSEDDVSHEAVLELEQEVLPFLLASHALWAIWSTVQALHRSYLPNSALVGAPVFGYWQYAESRFAEYFRLKAQLIHREGIFAPC